MPKDDTLDASDLAPSMSGRLRLIRVDHSDIAALAKAVGVPERTWLNYEAGVIMPAQVVLRLLCLTGAEPNWLLTGEGPRYRLAPEA